MKGAQDDPLESEIGHPYLTVQLQLHIEVGIIKTSLFFFFLKMKKGRVKSNSTTPPNQANLFNLLHKDKNGPNEWSFKAEYVPIESQEKGKKQKD